MTVYQAENQYDDAAMDLDGFTNGGAFAEALEEKAKDMHDAETEFGPSEKKAVPKPVIPAPKKVQPASAA